MSLFRDRLLLIGIFFASLLLFTVGLAQQELINFDTRFFLFAKEMFATHWHLFPTTYGKPYPDYPALSIIAINICATLLGGLNKFTAVLPSASCAALTVVTTFLIGRRINFLYGCFAALFLIGTLTFFKCARSISLDMYVTCFTAICFYALQKKSAIFYYLPCLILSFCVRGPIGLVIPTGVMVMALVVDNKWHAAFKVGVQALGILILCCALLMLAAYYTGGFAFMHEVLRMQILGRMDNPFLPIYFYFSNAIATYALSMPFAVLAIIAFVIDGRKNPQRREFLQFIAWLLVVLIGLSIPDDKKVRYILPAAPAMALLAAYPFAIGVGPAIRILRKVLVSFLFIFPTLILFAFAYTPKLQNFISASSYEFIFLLCIVTQLINFDKKYKNKKNAALIFLSMTVINFVSSYLLVIEPIELRLEASKAFVLHIEKIRQQLSGDLVFYKENPDGTPIKYLMNMPSWPQSKMPIFIHDNAALNQLHHPYVLMTSENYRAALPANFNGVEIGASKIGHVPMLAFVVKKIGSN